MLGAMSSPLPMLKSRYWRKRKKVRLLRPHRRSTPLMQYPLDIERIEIAAERISQKKLFEGYTGVLPARPNVKSRPFHANPEILHQLVVKS